MTYVVIAPAGVVTPALGAALVFSLEPAAPAAGEVSELPLDVFSSEVSVVEVGHSSSSSLSS